MHASKLNYALSTEEALIVTSYTEGTFTNYVKNPESFPFPFKVIAAPRQVEAVTNSRIFNFPAPKEDILSSM